MFIDARDILDGDTLTADVCIVGAGAAGITLALQLSRTTTRVLLLEDGALADDPEARGIYRVEPGRQPRLREDTTQRGRFGGNTNFWFGKCRPLDDHDFVRRDWIRYSGWPITGDQLAPYYERAHQLCGLGDYRCYDLDWVGPRLMFQPTRVDSNILASRVIHTCPVLSFADLHHEALRDAPNVKVCLHAHATKLETSSSGGAVRAVRVVAAGRRFLARARLFVLAAGGIENPRLLLCSNDVHPTGLGNSRDLVGRFFMEHVWADLPLGRQPLRSDLNFYYKNQHVERTTVKGRLQLSTGFMQRERAAGLCFWFMEGGGALSVRAAWALKSMIFGSEPRAEAATEIRAVLSDPASVAVALRDKLLRRKPSTPADGATLRVQVEQTPDPQNRVQLSPELDRFRQPRVELVLRRAGSEARSAARFLRIAASSIGLDGRKLARQLRLLLESGQGGYFWHHMGTTRMHSDPVQGVVDADCRVHDVANLYVGGCSVFPTGGTAGPTLTIVALALRLAEHIRQQLDQHPEIVS